MDQLLALCIDHSFSIRREGHRQRWLSRFSFKLEDQICRTTTTLDKLVDALSLDSFEDLPPSSAPIVRALLEAEEFSREKMKNLVLARLGAIHHYQTKLLFDEELSRLKEMLSDDDQDEVWNKQRQELLDLLPQSNMDDQHVFCQMITDRADSASEGELVNDTIEICEQAQDAISKLNRLVDSFMHWKMWDKLGGMPWSTRIQDHELEALIGQAHKLQYHFDLLLISLAYLKRSPLNPLRINIADFGAFSKSFFDDIIEELPGGVPMKKTKDLFDEYRQKVQSTYDYLVFGLQSLAQKDKVLYQALESALYQRR